ncbi:MAG: ATP-dependent Clp protease proteolytic subunit, partial [Anaerolineaceae bacterium]|nr:ATP-dependent Clp protease proteolytic subunit [Anaerolineaceae bacterium]
MKRIRFLLIAVTILLFVFQPARAESGSPLVLVMNIDGPIAPAVQEYLVRSLKLAEQQGAELLILQLNTPGGGIDTMNKMLQEMRASQVPIVVYVAPRGAMAGSAGTMITLAGHASAMAPETIIGAASPVGGQGEDLGDTLKAKEMEALKATVRTLTERRGAQAVQLAEDTIEKARAVSASEALQAGLVDFVATDVEDLISKLDGFTVETIDGERNLSTAGAVVETIPLTLIESILQMLTNPNVVFILLSIGVQAIFIELSSPGGWVAGFIGAVCLAFAGYGMGVLTVNWFGLLFLVIAFVLFIVDIKAPTHGALTVAGIGSFIIGALVLFNSPGTPQFQMVSLPLVILISILTGSMFAVIIGF